MSIGLGGNDGPQRNKAEMPPLYRSALSIDLVRSMLP